MYPEGLFGLDWLRVTILPVALFGIAFFTLYLRLDGVRVWRAIMLMVSVAIIALLGAKLFSLYTRGWDIRPLSQELRGGLRYPGAALAIVLLGPFLKRLILPNLPMTRFLDVLAITVCFSFALVRISCFLNGCCTGIQCDAGYCISFPKGSMAWYVQYQAGALADPSHDSHPVLPLNLLFMTASFAVGLFLMWFDAKRSYNGQLALLYLFLHDGIKGLLEALREPYVAELQITSLSISAAGLAGLLLIAFVRRRREGNSAGGT